MNHKHLSYPPRPLEVVLPVSVRIRDLQDDDKPFILAPWAKLTGRFHHRNISRLLFVPFLLKSMIFTVKENTMIASWRHQLFRKNMEEGRVSVAE